MRDRIVGVSSINFYTNLKAELRLSKQMRYLSE